MTQSRFQGRYLLSTSVALLAAIGFSGCGGSNSNTNTAHVRAYNAVENGGTSTVFVNSGSANGSQNFEQASSYLYLSGGQSTFTFTLGNFQSNAYPTVSHNLLNGQFYTAITYGRADVTATDLRYPNLLVLDDNSTAIPSGSALVRVVDAAPDGGTLTASVGGTQIASALAYGTASSYVAVSTGRESFVPTLSNAGVDPAINVTLASGSAYTIIVDERVIPSGSVAASYGSIQLQDN